MARLTKTFGRDGRSGACTEQKKLRLRSMMNVCDDGDDDECFDNGDDDDDVVDDDIDDDDDDGDASCCAYLDFEYVCIRTRIT